MYLCYVLLPRQRSVIFDDNESEMILGVNWDNWVSLGVKSALLGSTRYHRVSHRVLVCKNRENQ